MGQWIVVYSPQNGAEEAVLQTVALQAPQFALIGEAMGAIGALLIAALQPEVGVPFILASVRSYEIAAIGFTLPVVNSLQGFGLESAMTRDLQPKSAFLTALHARALPPGLDVALIAGDAPRSPIGPGFTEELFGPEVAAAFRNGEMSFAEDLV
ncbi:MAG: hypothetical protein AAB368_06990, partial [bacterium]